MHEICLARKCLRGQTQLQGLRQTVVAPSTQPRPLLLMNTGYTALERLKGSHLGVVKTPEGEILNQGSRCELLLPSWWSNCGRLWNLQEVGLA